MTLEKVNELADKLASSQSTPEIKELKSQIVEIILSYDEASIIQGYIDWETAIERKLQAPSIGFPGNDEEIVAIVDLVRFLEQTKY